MSIRDEKLIHDRRLYSKLSLSYQMGKRGLRELEARGDVTPEMTPSGREYLSPAEAERFSCAVSRG